MARTTHLKYSNGTIGVKDLTIKLEDDGTFVAEIPGQKIEATSYDALTEKVDAEVESRLRIVWTPLIRVSVRLPDERHDEPTFGVERLWRGESAGIVAEARWDVPEEGRLAKARFAERTLRDLAPTSLPLVTGGLYGNGRIVILAYDEALWAVLDGQRQTIALARQQVHTEVTAAIDHLRLGVLPTDKARLI